MRERTEAAERRAGQREQREKHGGESGRLTPWLPAAGEDGLALVERFGSDALALVLATDAPPADARLLGELLMLPGPAPVLHRLRAARRRLVAGGRAAGARGAGGAGAAAAVEPRRRRTYRCHRVSSQHVGLRALQALFGGRSGALAHRGAEPPAAARRLAQLQFVVAAGEFVGARDPGLVQIDPDPPGPSGPPAPPIRRAPPRSVASPRGASATSCR
ncbi:hypothetical protein [Streptomyces sp. NPDC088249]|uniref:hypothetical protein n=1 Tax=Streptomyces sp. NPDC088249 TaxID=3365843 RepID=UPI0037FA3EB7